MSALGQKQTRAVQNAMSALPPIADMCGATQNVRLVPIADILVMICLKQKDRREAVSPKSDQPGGCDVRFTFFQLLSWAPIMAVTLPSRCPQTPHDAVLRHHSYRGVQRSRGPPCAAFVRD
jgi:hypothetical protein